MKTSSSLTLLRSALAAVLVGGVALFAQEPPANPDRSSPPAAQKADPAPAPAPADTTPATPAPTAPPPAAESVSTPTPPVADATPKAEETTPPLRKIDEPENAPAPAPKPQRRNVHGRGGEVPFGDHHVGKDNSVSEVVSVFGSTVVEGEVRGDAVAVLGDARIGPDARVGGGVVAVLGDLTLEGEVRHDAVNVLGKGYINGPVRGQIVSVLGRLELGPKAVIEHDMVIVGGSVKKHPDAIVRGNTVNVPVLGGFAGLDWLFTWFKRCVLLGRPLAFGENLGWAWVIAGSFLGMYLLFALIFPRGIEKCVTTFETRPGASILASFLTVFLSPVAIVLLAVTVVGIVLIPFFGAALLGAKLFGKAVILAWIGRRFTRLFGDGPLGHPVFAVLIGGVLVLLLYTVPLFGFLLYKLLTWLGLGVVVYTVALSMKREKPAVAAGPSGDAGAGGASVPIPPVDVPPGPATPVAPMTEATPVAPIYTATPSSAAVPPPAADTGFAASSGFVSGGAAAASALPPIPPIAMPPPIPPRATATPPAFSAATLPRATFLVRMAALLLDLVLVGITMGLLDAMLPRAFHPQPPAILLLLAVYGAVMWKIKGTTIGGIVCGLKVVRVDDRPIDWPTAWVRAASCFLSLAVVGLGFLWVLIDDDKQSWHDKIAGTTVVRVPKGVSLI